MPAADWTTRCSARDPLGRRLIPNRRRHGTDAVHLPQWLPHGIALFGQLLHRTLVARDVHSQAPPNELSIALNVLGITATRSPLQYLFDIDEGTVPDRAIAYPAEALIRMARIAGDATCIDPLRHLAKNEPNPTIRRAASAAIEELVATDGSNSPVRCTTFAERRPTRRQGVSSPTVQRDSSDTGVIHLAIADLRATRRAADHPGARAAEAQGND